MIQLKPTQDRVIIRKRKAEEKTSGGLYLPDSARDVSQEQEGEVIAVGPGRVLDNGQHLPMTLQVGDRVYFAKYAVTELNHQGQELLILSERDVLAVIQKPAGLNPADRRSLIKTELMQHPHGVYPEVLALIPILANALSEQSEAEIRQFVSDAIQSAGPELDLCDALSQKLIDLPETSSMNSDPAILQQKLTDLATERDSLKAQVVTMATPKNNDEALLRGENPYILQEEDE